MSFYWFDIVAVVVLLVYVAFSWMKGFLRELFSAAAWVGGYFGAIVFSPFIAKIYKGYIKFPRVCDILAFISIFLAIYIAVRLMSYVVREKMGLKDIVPKLLNGPAGGLMGGLKGMLFISAMLIPLNWIPSWKQEIFSKSYVARAAEGISAMAAPVLGFDAAKAQDAIKDNMELIKKNLPAMPEAPATTAIPDLNINKPGKQNAPLEPKHHAPDQKEQSPPVAKAASPAQTGKALHAGGNPPLKKAEPVLKHRPEPRDDGDRERMDKFMRELH